MFSVLYFMFCVLCSFNGSINWRCIPSIWSEDNRKLWNTLLIKQKWNPEKVYNQSDPSGHRRAHRHRPLACSSHHHGIVQFSGAFLPNSQIDLRSLGEGWMAEWLNGWMAFNPPFRRDQAHFAASFNFKNPIANCSSALAQ